MEVNMTKKQDLEINTLKSDFKGLTRNFINSSIKQAKKQGFSECLVKTNDRDNPCVINGKTFKVVESVIRNINTLKVSSIHYKTFQTLWKKRKYRNCANKDFLEELCNEYRRIGFDVDLEELDNNNYSIKIQLS